MAEYRGLTIRIGADTGKFTAAMKAVSSTINSTQYQLNSLKKALALDPGNKGTAKAYIGELQSQAVAARSKIAELNREMEHIGSSMSKVYKYFDIKTIAGDTKDATLEAKRALEAYNNATEAVAQWYNALSRSDVAQGLGITFNAKNNDLGDIKAAYDLMVESGEKTREEADAEIEQLDRLTKAFKQLKNAKTDADKVETLHKDELAIAQLEAQFDALAKAESAATQGMVTSQFQESISHIHDLSTELKNAQERFEHLDNALKLDPTNLDIAKQRSEALAEVTRLAQEKAKALADAMADMDGSEFAKIAKESKNLTAGLSKAKDEYEEATKEVERLRSKSDMLSESMAELAAAGNKDTDAFRELAKQAGKVDDDLDRATKAADEAKEAFTQQVQATLFDGVKTDAADATEQIAKASAAARTAKEELSTSMFMALQELGQEAKQAFDSVVESTASLDDALTDVKKTVDTTEHGYEKLKDSAVELSKVQPIDAATILQAEALGGQLGFAADEVEKFAEVATGLDVATNMNWNDASTDMARFFNIMGLAPDKVENYGSAIVDLGNNYATTEQEISDMALRIAGAGASMNLGAADVLGLATALTSVGLTAEAGGSSISQIMVKIDKAVANGTQGIAEYATQVGMSVSDFTTYLSSLDDDAFGEVAESFGMTSKAFRSETLDSMSALQTWAETANMTADQFVDAWTNRPIEALTALFSGMDQAAQEGSNLNLLLEDLDITTIRQSDVARRVANSSEKLTKAVSDANAAYQQNTALSTEVQRRNESLSAQMDIMANAFDAVKAELGEGLLPMVKVGVSLFQSLSDSLDDMSTGTKTGILSFLGSLAAFGTTYPILHQISDAFDDVKEKVAKLGGLKSVLSSFGGSITSFISSPVTMAVAALGALGLAAYACYKNYQKTVVEVRKQQDDFNAALADTNEISSSMASSMEAGKSAVSSFGSEAERRSKSLEELTDEVNAFNEAIKDSMDPVDKSNALLGEYRGVIERFAGVGEAAGADLAELEWAVRGINETLGTNYTAQDILNDKYVSEEGEINNLCAHIDKLIEKRQEQARLTAAQDLYTKSLEKQYEFQMNVDFAKDDIEKFDRLVEERAATFEKLDNGVHTHEQIMEAAARSVSEDMGATREELERDAEAAQRALDAVDREVEYTKDLMADATKAMENNSESIAQFVSTAFQGWDIDWSDALERNGVSLDDFAQKAEEAGITLDDLKAIADNPDVFFSQWVDECEGDLDALIAKIEEYNNKEIEEKEVKVSVPDQKLALDESKLDPTANIKASPITVEVNTASSMSNISSLTEAIDNVPPKVETTAFAYTDTADRKLITTKQLADALPSLKTIWVSFSVDTSSLTAAEQRYEQFKARTNNAAGGIRYHADGVILNRPTWIGNRDIAGEAGAEAIIPLTNRRYVQPFADTVADGMMSKIGEMTGTTNNYVINGLTVAPDSALARAMDATFDEAKRLSRMGRR